MYDPRRIADATNVLYSSPIPPVSYVHAIPFTFDRVGGYPSDYPTPLPSPYGYDISPVTRNDSLPRVADSLPPFQFLNDSHQYTLQRVPILSPSGPCIIDPHTITGSYTAPQVLLVKHTWAYQIPPGRECDMVGEHEMFNMAEEESDDSGADIISSGNWQ